MLGLLYYHYLLSCLRQSKACGMREIGIIYNYTLLDDTGLKKVQFVSSCNLSTLQRLKRKSNTVHVIQKISNCSRMDEWGNMCISNPIKNKVYLRRNELQLNK